MMYTVKVVLTKNIKYVTLSGYVKRLAKGTELLVDVGYQIAYVDNEHFFIEPKEYKLLYVN